MSQNTLDEGVILHYKENIGIMNPLPHHRPYEQHRYQKFRESLYRFDPIARTSCRLEY